MANAQNNKHAYENYFESIELDRTPITSVKTPLFLASFADILTQILVSHGIKVEIMQRYCLITFPTETYKTELLPRTQDEKYKIVLSDGFEIHEVKRRYEEYSYLQIDPARLQPEQQQTLKEGRLER